MHVFNKLTEIANIRLARGMWAVVIMQTAGSIGFSISFTYLALYFYTVHNIPMTTVGTIMFVSGILSGIFQVIGGTIADRFGHRRTLVIYLLAEFTVSAVLAVFIALDFSLGSIIFLAILLPIVGGMTMATILAVIADLTPDHGLTESYGLIAITGNIGWAIGPLVGGYILGIASYGWLFGTGFLVSAFSLTGILFLPRKLRQVTPERITVNSLKPLIANKRLILFGLTSVLFFAVMAQWGSTLSVFSIERIGFSTEKYGWLMSISGWLIVIFQYPVSRRIEWLGIRKALFLGCALYGIGFLLFSWINTFVPATGTVIIIVIGEMLFVPTAFAVVGRLSNPNNRGQNMGFFGLCTTLGESVGPLIGGFLLDTYPKNPFALWGTVAVVSFIGAVGFVLWPGYSSITKVEEFMPD